MQNFRPFVVATLLGVALAYIAPIADALQAALVQRIYVQEWIHDFPTVRAALLQLPILSLPTLVLVYLLGIVAFGVRVKLRALLIVALLLPLTVQALWFSWQISGGSWLVALKFGFGTQLAALSWLAVVLSATLAFSRTHDRSADRLRRCLTPHST